MAQMKKNRKMGSPDAYAQSTVGKLILGGFVNLIVAVIAALIAEWLRRREGRKNEGGARRRPLKIYIWILPILFFMLAIVLFITACLLSRTPELKVSSFYFPSGKVGDIGDVTFGTGKFTYEPLGRGSHEYEWKYNEDGSVNQNPAGFAGVCWLNPAGNFGTMSGGGKDLSAYNKIHWEGRSLGDPVNVEFFIGGVTWIWGKDDDGKPKIVEPPYPGVPKYGLGTHKLTSDWQEFDVPLGVEKEDLDPVICGFGWVASWGNNDVQLDEDGTGPVEKKKFEFEIREIRYEKGD